MSHQPNGRKTFDLELLRERLHSARGPEYWRSLEEVAGTEEFREFLHNEFPSLLPTTSEASAIL